MADRHCFTSVFGVCEMIIEKLSCLSVRSRKKSGNSNSFTPEMALQSFGVIVNHHLTSSWE